MVNVKLLAQKVNRLVPYRCRAERKTPAFEGNSLRRRLDGRDTRDTYGILGEDCPYEYQRMCTVCLAASLAR